MKQGGGASMHRRLLEEKLKLSNVKSLSSYSNVSCMRDARRALSEGERGARPACQKVSVREGKAFGRNPRRGNAQSQRRLKNSQRCYRERW
eukprot:6192912-Pleurochrysis_carterae.AAC.1